MFHGRYTANGEIYDMNALTAAHPTLPLPTYARVTNLQNGRSLIVRVNDRGPYAADRIIDMSRRSAQALGFQRDGTARVRVQYLGRAPLDGNDNLERRSFANLNNPKTVRPRVRLAAARPKRNLRMADPMVVGAIPKQEARRAPSKWMTQVQSAGLSNPANEDLIFIQAASFQNRVFAENLRNQLADFGPAGVFPAQIKGKKYYRVRLGPYAQRHEADQALRVVVNSGSLNARIIRD
jgi:rare lipoprotein A